ncbi:universal stress protein, partial [bacterium]|nr:universal stress protein [bacterium]
MKIVLATDGSDHSESAAKFLSKLRLTPEDEIIIIHAISWVPIMHEWGALFEDFKEIREEIVPRILDAAEDALQPCQAAITRVFAENYPDKAIIDTAKTSKADMIVLGARGVKGIVTHLVGSIT